MRELSQQNGAMVQEVKKLKEQLAQAAAAAAASAPAVAEEAMEGTLTPVRLAAVFLGYIHSSLLIPLNIQVPEAAPAPTPAPSPAPVAVPPAPSPAAAPSAATAKSVTDFLHGIATGGTGKRKQPEEAVRSYLSPALHYCQV